MSSSDSSEDENTTLLREAVDSQFIHDGMFSSSSTTSSKSLEQAPSINNEQPPSLRPNTNTEDQFNMLGVTPQFQEYVAKQLSNLLDEKLKKRFTNGEGINKPPQKRKKCGIKLLKDSKKYLKLTKTEQVTFRKRVESVSDNEEKFSEVSVSSKDILSKKDVEKWSTRSKAKVFKYKKTKNDTLMSLD